jgi:hypothetical protein
VRNGVLDLVGIAESIAVCVLVEDAAPDPHFNNVDDSVAVQIASVVNVPYRKNRRGEFVSLEELLHGAVTVAALEGVDAIAEPELSGVHVRTRFVEIVG